MFIRGGHHTDIDPSSNAVQVPMHPPRHSSGVKKQPYEDRHKTNSDRKTGAIAYIQRAKGDHEALYTAASSAGSQKRCLLYTSDADDERIV